MHILSPPVSPASVPQGRTAARLELSNGCPGCAPSRATTAAVDKMGTLIRVNRQLFQSWEPLDLELQRTRALLNDAIVDKACGADGPQIKSVAAERVRILETFMNDCLDRIARAECRISKARRKWGQLNDGIFKTHRYEPRSRLVKTNGNDGTGVKPKAVLRLKIGGSGRKYPSSMILESYFGTASRYMAMDKLELP